MENDRTEKIEKTGSVKMNQLKAGRWRTGTEPQFVGVGRGDGLDNFIRAIA